MAEKLAGGGVADGALVAELIELADIVKDASGEQEIDIKLGIMRGDAAGHAAEGHDMFEQAAEIRVVHDLGGWGALIAARGFGIGENAEDEPFQPRIGDGFRITVQLDKQ